MVREAPTALVPAATPAAWSAHRPWGRDHLRWAPPMRQWGSAGRRNPHATLVGPDHPPAPARDARLYRGWPGARPAGGGTAGLLSDSTARWWRYGRAAFGFKPRGVGPIGSQWTRSTRSRSGTSRYSCRRPGSPPAGCPGPRCRPRPRTSAARRCAPTLPAFSQWAYDPNIVFVQYTKVEAVGPSRGLTSSAKSVIDRITCSSVKSPKVKLRLR
jgi:hypothetical protein